MRKADSIEESKDDVFSRLNRKSTITSRKKEKGPTEKKKSIDDFFDDTPGL